jgi:spore coat protein A, manganese oxidase
MISRRDFLKLSGAGMLSLYAASRGKFTLRAQAQIPGGSLNPGLVPKYTDQLVIPPAMPGAFAKNQDKYRIAVRQFQQHILPQSMNLPPTTVWSYGSIENPGTFNYPT